MLIPGSYGNIDPYASGLPATEGAGVYQNPILAEEGAGLANPYGMGSDLVAAGDEYSLGGISSFAAPTSYAQAVENESLATESLGGLGLENPYLSSLENPYSTGLGLAGAAESMSQALEGLGTGGLGLNGTCGNPALNQKSSTASS